MANDTKLPADGTRVRAMTFASDEYETPARAVVGVLTTRYVPVWNNMQCWVDGVQVDPATVRAAKESEE